MKILSTPKERNSRGETCWPGYKRHPTIKEGPGSCVPQTADAPQGLNMYGAVVEYNGEDELLIGRGCILLTRRFVRYGVSAHVLPGSLSDSGRQLIALIGMSKTGVAAALRKYEPTRPELLKIIMRLPVLF